jgi:hypothetical protein
MHAVATDHLISDLIASPAELNVGTEKFSRSWEIVAKSLAIFEPMS